MIRPVLPLFLLMTYTWLETGLTYVALGALLVVNLICVALVVLQLPGTWLMVATTALIALWRWDDGTIGLGTLVTLLVLAVLGELIETGASSIGARRAGGTKRGMVGAMVGGLIGAVVGTILILIPVVGTVVGASIGAGLGSLLADVWAGQSWKRAFKAGQGAAKGKLLGTVGKVIVAVLMWIVVTVAVFWT